MSSEGTPGSIPTSASFLEKLKNEDPGPRNVAWEQFQKRYAPIIAGFARNMGARPQEIDDLVQDVMLNFFRGARSFTYDGGKGRFRGYLKTCTFHALHKRLGREAKFKTKPLDEVDPESPEVEETWNHIWQQEQLRRALEATREDYSGEKRKTFRAFELYAILGKPVEQVAGELGISTDSVYQAKRRITHALRAKVSEMDQEDG